ncbi:hypothetical protein AB0J25_28640 [Streptomyces sp. NPDC049910]|uniref:hypothetical protein n=1 Tax=Streptomyces sp. NPDC049910 TaxID=3155278 RepID=UPI0034283D0C
MDHPPPGVQGLEGGQFGAGGAVNPLAAYHPGRKGVMLCFADDTVEAALHREELVARLFTP